MTKNLLRCFRLLYCARQKSPLLERILGYLLLGLVVLPIDARAGEAGYHFSHPLYVGGMAGYGSTTWDGLVPASVNASAALSLSTPIHVSEGGFTWGFFAGYEISPFFALEASYLRFPDATVTFDEISLFAFEHDGRLSFQTRTEMLALLAKIMLVVPNTSVRLYSGAGIANVHRHDEVIDYWQVSPTFGVGLNYNLTEHIMGEIGANYTAGYGESEISPVEDYVPFLYAVFLRIAYRF